MKNVGTVALRLLECIIANFESIGRVGHSKRQHQRRRGLNGATYRFIRGSWPGEEFIHVLLETLPSRMPRKR